jgi:pimeloyl-ACP methyl ester carboxylesterase
MADDTAALMDATGKGPAHVIGVSMGGRIAMALALQHPEKVRSLILVSTFARQIHNPGEKGFSGLINRTPKYVEGLSEYPQPQYAFVRQMVASRTYDCSDRLDRISVPTLVLHGKSDTLVPLALAEELRDGIAGSKMAAFEGGHTFLRECRRGSARRYPPSCPELKTDKEHIFPSDNF